MQPDFIIDKCESIKDRVISLHLTDESGIIDDVVEVCVDYRDEDIDIPNELNIALGYKETGIFPMGIYTVNEVTIQGPPKTLLIKAHATNLRISLKAKVSKEWHQITIENLVKEIAQKHGYGHKVAEEFKNVLIPHINQADESDISLLTKIVTEREAMAKLAGGYILFISKNMAKSATGKALGTTTIRPQDTINWKVHFTVRDKYNSVVAKWHSYEKGETIKETVGSGEPSYIMLELYSNAESALSAANAKLKQLKLNNETLDVTMPGNPQIFAEAKLNLLGFNQALDGEWIINRAEHTLNSSGYLTMLSASLSK
ncbi:MULTISPECIES: contractile injection system protein, VgrG/Pvc8 family [unclassified Wolbachia]|uniref:contractile injection system protein, VgrG/Pvc8 family n=1 Tax=unclassified Wolbachia TaxID=2640676 RepID=UPI001106B077|nr:MULTISPECIES: contractile injection system protein, VgrG/Pvc8 family [unclassified Wolbachia]QVU16143.1 Phage late control protein GpD [Wolbachia endosymbiont of Drosophila yakuba]QVU17357.1 Phage late control protein GpD [Wolbachia endosymbiont of Drosophila santomea]QWE32297.1 Phage late control protein GpD [Wolbachia endosymbiont of Drosophila simulans]TLW81485.1 phage tail protein [Wolbachia endosymbiont of Drosophila santomea]TLW85482.1 phage tail protein [Wolbachia endosymbiont of Dro